MGHDDRMRLASALGTREARARLGRLRDREASLVTVLDVSEARLGEVRGEIAELERVVKWA